jgi:hypothetical protein
MVSGWFTPRADNRLPLIGTERIALSGVSHCLMHLSAKEGRPVRMWSVGLLGLKMAVAGYWIWVAKTLILGSNGAFDAVIALSAPLVLSFHFIQAVTLLRRVRSSEPFWRQLLQTLLFGALYLAPLLLRPRRSSP